MLLKHIATAITAVAMLVVPVSTAVAIEHHDRHLRDQLLADLHN